MNRITCNVITDLLELYSDGVVSEDTRAIVEDHLYDCAMCKEKLAQIRRTLNIPAEVNAEPIKKIKRRIKKKNIIISVVSIVVVASILLGAFIFMTQYEVAMPFERTHIFNAELDVGDGEIRIHFMDNIAEYAQYGKLLADGTIEYYIYFKDTYSTRYFSNHASVNSYISIPAFEGWSYDVLNRVFNQMGVEATIQSQDGEFIEVQTVRVYYCTFGGTSGRMDFSERHLIWER